MDVIKGLAQRYQLRIVEDAAQAHGAEIDGQRFGSFGDIGCFSFYPGKNLGAFGDAGACVTNDRRLAEKLKLLRNYGQKVKNRHDSLAFNCRLDTIQAAVLNVKMKYLEGWTEHRQRVAGWYREALSDSSIVLPMEHAHMRHVYHLFVCRHPRRDDIVAQLAREQIFTGIHYPRPLSSAQPFRDSLCFPLELPVASDLAQQIFSLPIAPSMTRGMVNRVAENVKQVVESLETQLY